MSAEEGSKPLVSLANLGTSPERLVRSIFLEGLSPSLTVVPWTGAPLGFTVLGAPRLTGVTTNRFSSLALVGKSSKISSSAPSPKFLFLVGWVNVSIAAASLLRCSGATVGVALFAFADAVDEDGEWRGVRFWGSRTDCA